MIRKHQVLIQGWSALLLIGFIALSTSQILPQQQQQQVFDLNEAVSKVLNDIHNDAGSARYQQLAASNAGVAAVDKIQPTLTKNAERSRHKRQAGALDGVEDWRVRGTFWKNNVGNSDTRPTTSTPTQQKISIFAFDRDFANSVDLGNSNNDVALDYGASTSLPPPAPPPPPTPPPQTQIFLNITTYDRQPPKKIPVIQADSASGLFDASNPTHENSLAQLGTAYAAEEVSRRVSSHFGLNSSDQTALLSFYNLRSTSLDDECAATDASRRTCMPSDMVFRTADGSCNNLEHPGWGKSFMPFKRYLPPAYADGISRPRERKWGQLPSPRAISSRLMGQQSVQSKKYSHMLMIWGQFVDHDMTKAAITKVRDEFSDLPHDPACCTVLQPNERRHAECFPIAIPQDDYFYRNHNQTCMEFVRSLPATRENCSLGYREQLNELTAFLDGSQIYGSTLKYMQHLRLGRKGQLKTADDLLHPKGLLPFDDQHKIDCPMKTKFLKCFMAGDTRANEHTGLAALHTVWLREHNRIALELAALNADKPTWNDDRIFHEARKIVGAMIQHITFNEFLPILLGPNVMRQYNLTVGSPTYDRTRNPTIANVFSAAIFRFGHSLIQGDFMLMDGEHHKMRMEDLVNNFMRPFNLLLPDRVDAFVMGMAGQEAQELDNNFNERIMNHLFQNRGFNFGMDLIAINIQRGRDHGLPDYNSWRTICGLPKIRSMQELMQQLRPLPNVDFNSLYMSPDEVDLFPAGMSEKPYAGSLLGPTFSCLMAQQFSDVKNGDRFWYENEGLPNSFTKAQLAEIRKATLATVLCNNLDTTTETQRWAFQLQDVTTNPMVQCDDLPAIDLTKWKA